MGEYKYPIAVTLYVLGETEEQAKDRADMFLWSNRDLADAWGVEDWDVED